MTERLARASSRRPWLVVGLWIVAILVAFFLVAMFYALEGEAEITRQTESKQAEQIFSAGFPRDDANEQAITEVVVVRADNGDVEATAEHGRRSHHRRDARTRDGRKAPARFRQHPGRSPTRIETF